MVRYGWMFRLLTNPSGTKELMVKKTRILVNYYYRGIQEGTPVYYKKNEYPWKGRQGVSTGCDARWRDGCLRQGRN
jgi:hypothetical protein